MTHFWASSGHLLLDREPSGGLRVTDDFLKAYLARPELLPPEEACEAERALHARLMETPQAEVPPAAIEAIADEDARENWRFMLGWRDRLLAAPTLEAAYAGIIREGVSAIPPLFLDQLVHVIMRAALNEADDPFVTRAAECLFRPQRVTFHENTILLADAEMIEGHEADRHASPLLAMLGGPAATAARHPQARQCRPVLAALGRVRHGARSRRVPIGPRGAGPGACATGSARSMASTSRSSRWRPSPMPTGAGSSGSTPRPPRSAMRSGRETRSLPPTWRACSPCSP